ncbi:hypothetical protein ACTXT7_004064 [Hymenolepis weldensis]
MTMSREQSERIESVFNKIQDNEALYIYYTTSQGCLTKEAFESIVKKEGGNLENVESLTGNLTQDEFNTFFNENRDATPMSSWIFRRSFTIANEVLKLPSKSFIFSISTGSLFRFLDCDADGVIDIRDFLQGLSVLYQTPNSDFVKVVYQMYLRDSESGNENFNVDGFEICLAQFVPERIIKKTASNMGELKTCTSSSRFSSWASENPSFQYFVKFIKTVVFGFPLPHLEENMVEIIMIWLQFVINQGPKLGSQWYLFSLKYWPSIFQGNFSSTRAQCTTNMKVGVVQSPALWAHAVSDALKRLEYNDKYGANHPISMYDRIFTPTSPSSLPLETDKHRKRGRVRMISEGGVNESSRSRSQWILARRREPKNEREQSRSVNWLFRKSKIPSLSPNSVPPVGSTSPPTALISRQESMTSTKTPDKDWRAEDGPFMAVDRRLAERMQQWRQGRVGSGGQVMPSYLIVYVPYNHETSEETLEVQSLEICVRAVAGIKVKYLPLEGLITNIKPPKNRCLREFFLPGRNQVSPKKHYVSGGESNGSDVGSVRHKQPKSLDSTVYVRKRSASSITLLTDTTVGNNSGFLVISTQKLIAKSLRFAFSRCHTVSEVFEAICKYYADYRGCDLDSENCRMWLVISPDPSEIFTRSRNHTISKMSTTVGNSSHTEYATDTTNESIGCFSSKRLTLMPIDLKIVGDQQLARYLADQEMSFYCSRQLLNPEARCSRTFDFIIECRLAKEYIKLLDQMQTSGEPLNPQPLRRAFVQKWPNFNSYAQQDAQEFLTIFLDSLNEELRRKPQPEENGLSKSFDNHVSRKRHELFSATRIWDTFCANNDSPIVKMFYGLCESKCKFDGCSHSSSAFDPFSGLTLPLPFNTIESVTLTDSIGGVVPHFGAVPEVIRTKSDKMIDFAFVREEIARRYKCSANCIFFVRLISGTFKPILSKSNYQVSSKERSVDKAWAFILPEHHSEYTVGKEYTIILQNRILVPSNTAILEGTVYTPELMGDPTVIQVSTNATNKDLYNAVGKAIRRFVRSSQDPKKHSNCSRTAAFLKSSNDDGLEKCTRKCTALRFDKYDTSDYFFSIKQSDRHWFKCSRCPWSKMCRGCQVPVNSDKVDLICTEDTCVYLAVDWNLAAYVNEYQQTQETKKKIVDPVEDRDNLNMKNACQLDCLLQSYFGTEDASKEECVTCERCDKRKCFSKSTAICVLPDVLVDQGWNLISLKRFQATKCGWRKLTTLVEFPLTSLDMRPYLSEDVRIKETTYDLYGVVNHTGTLNEGHYYAHIKSESDGLWFRVNDIQCNEIPIQSVVTPDAYVLFYQRRMP